jgi:23S rRNA (pseudouridine1915-N3)-methyltransferase
VEIKELAEGIDPEAEAEDILRVCKGYVIALAVEGEKLSSEGLAKRMKKLSDEGKDVTFVIGSSCGLSEKVKQKADFKLSFSDMTFPHQLMRVILAEQVYRAFMINAGATYHK